MAFAVESKATLHGCCKSKYCFNFLLLINALIAVAYFIFDSYGKQKNLSTLRFNAVMPSINSTNEPIDSVKHVLEQNYKTDDLDRFYRMVNEEFMLGLRCMRKIKATTVKDPNINQVKETIKYE
jgi:hypothetical protein